MKNKKLFTVVTSTYNRGENLLNLFNSLNNQAKYNFIWLVIDDCSTDNTLKIINKCKKESNFEIIYHLQPKRGGKHRALNYAFKNVNTPLLIVIDSDDCLINNGSLKIENLWEKYKGKHIDSIVMERENKSKMRPILDIRKKDNGLITSRYDYIDKRHLKGDFADVYVTKSIREYRFPEFSGELFISEGPFYYWFSKEKDKKSLFIDSVLTEGNYLNDGLTNHIRELQVKNWKGTLYELSLYISKGNPILKRIKKAILFDYILLRRKKKISSINSNEKMLLRFCYLPAYIYFTLYKIGK